MAETIKLAPQDAEAFMSRVKSNTLTNEDCRIIATMLKVITELTQVIDQKATYIKKLVRMLFGSSTEKMSNILNEEENKPEAPETESTVPESEDPPEKPSDNPEKKKKKKKAKGHGRNGAAAYTGRKRSQF